MNNNSNLIPMKEGIGSFDMEPAGKEGQNCLQLFGPDAFTFHDGGCNDYKSVMCEAPSIDGGECNS